MEYVCPKCNGILLESRRANHDRYWCTEEEGEDSGEEKAEKSSLEEKASQALLQAGMAGSTCFSTCEYEFVHHPHPDGLHLSFEQQSLFGPLSTGAALWFAEVLLAEWFVKNAPFNEAGVASDANNANNVKSDSSSNGNNGSESRAKHVLELGCGGVPCAGMGAMAMGYNVVFTDLGVVLPTVERNLKLNGERILAASGREDQSLSRRDADCLELKWGEILPQRIIDLCPFEFILCSDCFYRTDLHALLAHTFRRLLEAGADKKGGAGRQPTRIIAAFQKRAEHELDFFIEALPAVGLCAKAIGVDELLRTVKRPSPMGGGEFIPHAVMREYTFLYSIQVVS